MDYQPNLTVRTRFNTAQNDCWVWIIKRLNDDQFEMKFDGCTYVYPMEKLSEIVTLIAQDHVRRHYSHENFLIESNLGFAPWESKGDQLHKHLSHSLFLFANVIKISHPPIIKRDHIGSSGIDVDLT